MADRVWLTSTNPDGVTMATLGSPEDALAAERKAFEAWYEKVLPSSQIESEALRDVLRERTWAGWLARANWNGMARHQ